MYLIHFLRKVNIHIACVPYINITLVKYWSLSSAHTHSTFLSVKVTSQNKQLTLPHLLELREQCCMTELN